jgi:putative membrane protein insertion efficiency factor
MERGRRSNHVNAAQHILIFGVEVYRRVISPAKALLLGPLAGCRFTPSCSAYAREAVCVHGAIAGSWLAAGRICRCHPWGGCGDDPVPAAPPASWQGSALPKMAVASDGPGPTLLARPEP